MQQTKPSKETIIATSRATDHPLFGHIQSGNLAEVARLLAEGVSPNSRNKEQNTSLQHAVLYQQEAIVEEFLQRPDVEIDAAGQFGMTALHYAVTKQNLALATRLIQAGAQVNRQNAQFRTPLHFATSTKNVVIASYLLGCGASLQMHDKDKRTVLHRAVIEQCLPLVELFVRYGAQFDAPDQAGQTPLHLAVRQDTLEIARYLIQRGADMRIPDLSKEKVTALDLVKSKRQTGVYDAIQKDIPTYRQKLFEIAQKSIQSKTEVPIDLAGNWMSDEQLQAIEYSLQDNEAITELWLGAHQDRQAVSQDVAEHINLHVKANAMLKQALALTHEGNIHAVQALTRVGTPLRNYYGYTNLHLIAMTGQEALLSEAVQSDPCFNVKDRYARTASAVARQHRHHTLSQTLKQYEKEHTLGKLLQEAPNHTQRVDHFLVERRALYHHLEVMSEEDPIGTATRHIWKLLNRKTACDVMELEKNYHFSDIIRSLTLPQHYLTQAQNLPAQPVVKQSSSLWSVRPTKASAEISSVNLGSQVDTLLGPLRIQIAQLEKLITTLALAPQRQHEDIIQPLKAIIQHYQQFEQRFVAASLAERTMLTIRPATLKGSACGPRLLKSEVARQLFEDKQTQHSGTHDVRSIQGVHFKKDPHAPGVEFMVDSLNKTIAGQGSTPTELIKIIDKQGTPHCYLASKTVFGTELGDIITHHPQHLNKIDPFNFSAMILSSLLTNPQDGKADNYMAKIEGRDKENITSIEIIGIDNDIAFTSPIVLQTRGKFAGQHFIDLKNVLYFFPQMQAPIHPVFRDRLLSRAVECVMVEWLESLYEKNLAYQALLDEQTFSQIEFSGDGSEDGLRLRLPITFVPGTVRAVYRKLCTLQEHLRHNLDATHNDLFRLIEPVLFICYQETQQRFGSDIIECLADIYHGDSVEERCERYYKALEAIPADVRTAIDDVQEAVYAFENRTQLLTEATEEFIADIDFSRFSQTDQERIVTQHLTKLYYVRHLVFSNLHLSDGLWLSQSVRAFRQAESIVFRGRSAITLTALRMVASARPDLNLIIDGACEGLNAENWHEIVTFHRQVAFQYTNATTSPPTQTLLWLHRPIQDMMLEVVKHGVDHDVLWAYLADHRQANMQARYTGGDTLLHLAVKERQYETANRLLSHKVNVNQKNDAGYTPLHIAASMGNDAMITLLTSHHADLHAKDKYGKTPLEKATSHQHLTTISLLQALQKGGTHSSLESSFGMQIKQGMRVSSVTNLRHRWAVQPPWKITLSTPLQERIVSALGQALQTLTQIQTEDGPTEYRLRLLPHTYRTESIQETQIRAFFTDILQSAQPPAILFSSDGTMHITVTDHKAITRLQEIVNTTKDPLQVASVAASS